MYYPDEVIDEVRTKNDIVDVVSGYVKLQKKGSSYFGLCPFHSEKSPSFSVSPQKQIYYCFGCGAGGNVISFYMQYENATFQEAVQALAEKAGIKLPQAEYSAEVKKRESKRTKLLEINKEAATYFFYQLRSEKGKAGLDYLKKRELSDETIHKFGLGFANMTSSDLVKHLKSKGYSDELIRDAGLATFDEKHGMHDKFWNRVMFPIQDINHRVIGFGGRVMGDGKPKYLNSPETEIFDKSRNLYGLNIAKTARKKQMILCEGYMDVITMHQAGFTQAVASLGTAFTQGQAALLKRYTDEVILSYDSDTAGVTAALRAIGILKEAGMTGKVLNLEPFKDPDEFIRNRGAEAFEERLQQAENAFFFEIRMLERNFDLKDPESKTKFYREIARKLCGFSEELERDNYTQAIADRYGIGVQNLRKLVVSYASQTGFAQPMERPKSGIKKKNTAEESIRRSQRLLLTWLTDRPSLYRIVRKYIAPEDFTEELYRAVAEILFQQLEEDKLDPSGILSHFEEEDEQRLVAEVFHTKLESLKTRQEQEKAFHDVLLSVKRNSYEQKLSEAGTDVGALSAAIAGKKALEELSKAHITIE